MKKKARHFNKLDVVVGEQGDVAKITLMTDWVYPNETYVMDFFIPTNSLDTEHFASIIKSRAKHDGNVTFDRIDRIPSRLTS